MQGHQTELGTSEALSHGIRVEVHSQYLSEHSDPDRNEWLFGYAVRITNEGSQSVQLINRHWVITDGNGDVQEVRGPGVIGQQPIIEPGGSHMYTSYCPLPTPVGTMEGSYGMVAEGGETVDVRVARFTLSQPAALN